MRHIFTLFLTIFFGATLAAYPQTQGAATDSLSIDEAQPLFEVARKQGLAAEHLAWANDLELTAWIEADEELHVPSTRILPKAPPENGLVVNLAERGAYFFQNGKYQKFYPLAIGRAQPAEYRTPTGSFKLVSVIENPEWKAPDSEWARAYDKDTIAADSPENPLGDYWFGINAPGYGFHENVNPSYTGAAASHGCMRLYPEHASELYGLLEEGMPVEIFYDTVRTHQDDEQVYVSVFPDVYDKMVPEDNLRRGLEQLNLRGLADESRVQTILEEKRGVPVPLLTTVNVEIGGNRVSTERPPVLRKGQVMLPTTAVEALGLEARYRPETRSLELTGNGRNLTVEAPLARWGDATYVSARELIDAFSLAWEWQGQDKTLRLERSR